jgi:hypothetical protein
MKDIHNIEYYLWKHIYKNETIYIKHMHGNNVTAMLLSKTVDFPLGANVFSISELLRPSSLIWTNEVIPHEQVFQKGFQLFLKVDFPAQQQLHLT